MPPSTASPIVLLLWVLGTPTALAGVVWAVKGIYFIAKASGKLDLIDEMNESLKQIRHDRRDDQQALTISLSFIEEDVNILQRRANLPERRYPDRRTGPQDRRVG